MMQYALLEQLNDCEFHSGEQLAKQLGVTRAAVWKQLKALQDKFGVELYAVTGRGYRLPKPVELLNKVLIQRSLKKSYGQISVETFLSIDSTNSYLINQLRQSGASPRVVLAEHQTAGKGRRGRTWISPFGNNLYLSIMYRMDRPLHGLSGLSLAVAVAIAGALKTAFNVDAQLKWPNDILFDGKKLCGILLELQGENDGPTIIIVGVGLNVDLSDLARKQIDQPCVSLSDLTTLPISRNQLAIVLTQSILAALSKFESDGMKAFLQDWDDRDIYRDKAVRLQLGNHLIEGVCRGIDEHGALLVEIDGEVRRYYSGDISLRAGA